MRAATSKALMFSMVFVATLLATGCSKPRDAPEAEIERLLSTGAEALESRSIDGLKVLISDHYRDEQGRDKKALLRTAFMVFQRGPIRVLRVGTAIDATMEKGVASFTVHALQGHNAPETPLELLPQRVRGYRVVLYLGWEGGVWKLQSMEGVQ